MRAGDHLRALAVVAVLLGAGCRRDAATPALPQPEATGPAPAEPAASATDFVRPATLAELDRQVTWVDRPVRDARTLGRTAEGGEPPDRPVAAVLALPNDSPETNAELLAALARPLPAGERVAADRVALHVPADVTTLNPILAETATEFEVLELTGVSLFGFDHDIRPFANADVVSRWRSSADGRVDRVVLRDDLTWNDGTRVTAHDVAFTWRLIRDPRVPARGFREAAGRLLAVHAYDDRTVVFFHAEPLATAAWSLDFPVLPRQRYERSWDRDPTLRESPAHAALEARPVTAGPYEIAARTPGREIVLRRRAGWATVRGRAVREPAACAEIRLCVHEDPAAALEALVTGGLDEAVLDPQLWANWSDGAVAARAARVRTPDRRLCQFLWNLDSPPFADRRVRRAMGYALDHGRLLETICHGLAAPATGVFPPGAWATAPRQTTPSRQDLDKAEALLDEAGWVDRDGDGVRDKEIDGRLVPFAFTVLCERRPFRVAICRLLEEGLRRVGVTCVVRPVDPAELLELVHARRFDACLVSRGAGADPDMAATFWQADGPQNACGYANAEVDRLFAAGRREQVRQRRAEHYARIEEILSDDQPCTWLFWEDGLRGFSQRLGGDLFHVRPPVHWSPGLSTIWRPTLD